MSAAADAAKELARLGTTFLEFVNRIAGAPLEEIGGLAADQIKLIRFQRRLKILETARRYIAEAGLEPKPVAHRVLGPVLESASLEEDVAMADRWAALLANASGRGAVPPSFPRILAELSPEEAKLLDGLVREAKRHEASGSLADQDGHDERVVRMREAMASAPTPDLAHALVNPEQVAADLALAPDVYEVMMDNLFRQRLCAHNFGVRAGAELNTWHITKEDPARPAVKAGLFVPVAITPLAIAFVAACTPPERSPASS